MDHLGENLSSYRGLSFFEGNSPEEILLQLNQIRLPYKILSIYGSGAKHYCWIDSGANKIVKVKKTKKQE
jgi:hypothetical protein